MSEPAGPPPAETGSLGLPRQSRVLSSRDFRRIYAQGQRARGQLLTAVARRRQDGKLRLGLSVSKDHGPAVRRNKIKRILREAFRLERPGLPGGFDLVLIPTPSDAKLRLAAVRDELRRLVHELAKKPSGRRRR